MSKDIDLNVGTLLEDIKIKDEQCGFGTFKEYIEYFIKHHEKEVGKIKFDPNSKNEDPKIIQWRKYTFYRIIALAVTDCSDINDFNKILEGITNYITNKNFNLTIKDVLDLDKGPELRAEPLLITAAKKKPIGIEIIKKFLNLQANPGISFEYLNGDKTNLVLELYTSMLSNEKDADENYNKIKDILLEAIKAPEKDAKKTLDLFNHWLYTKLIEYAIKYKEQNLINAIAEKFNQGVADNDLSKQSLNGNFDYIAYKLLEQNAITIENKSLALRLFRNTLIYNQIDNLTIVSKKISDKIKLTEDEIYNLLKPNFDKYLDLKAVKALLDNYKIDADTINSLALKCTLDSFDQYKKLDINIATALLDKAQNVNYSDKQLDSVISILANEKFGLANAEHKKFLDKLVEKLDDKTATNLVFEYTNKCFFGYKPLDINIDIANILLDKLKDINSVDSQGNTILRSLLNAGSAFSLSNENHKKFLEKLIEKGADPEIKDKKGKSLVEYLNEIDRNFHKEPFFKFNFDDAIATVKSLHGKYLEAHPPVVPKGKTDTKGATNATDNTDQTNNTKNTDPDTNQKTNKHKKPKEKTQTQEKTKSKGTTNSTDNTKNTNTNRNSSGDLNNPPPAPPKTNTVVETKKWNKSIETLAEILGKPLAKQLELGEKINIKIADYIKEEYKLSQDDINSIDKAVTNLKISDVTKWQNKSVNKKLQKAYIGTSLGLLCTLIYLFVQGANPNMFDSISKAIPGSSGLFNAAAKAGKLCMENKFFVGILASAAFVFLGVMFGKNIKDMSEKDQNNIKKVSGILLANIQNDYPNRGSTKNNAL